MNQTATVVILFCDLVESTALMTAVGDDDADLIRREMFTKWRAAIENSGGTVVKTAGDGFMAVFPTSAGDAVHAADSLRAAMSTIDSPRPLRLRVGIAAGEASNEDGDWFGTPVVEAARLCAAADPDEILLSETARKLVGSRGAHEFTAVGRLTLKGLGEPLLSYALGPDARKRRSPRTMRWVAVGVLFALVVAGGVVAVSTTSGGDGTGAPPVPKPEYTPRLSDRPCSPDESAGDSRIVCQTLTVPENRGKPRGRQVRLAVVQAPATGPHPSTPTILLCPTCEGPVGDPLRSASTLISLGLRGRGASEPSLACTEFAQSRAARLALGWRAEQRLYAADIDTCLQRVRQDGVDLRQYDFGDVADDVRDLAVALSVRQITLRADFDASRAVVAVVHRYPGLLRSALLEYPRVPPISATQNQPLLFEHALSLLAKRCRDDRNCAKLFPDLVRATEGFSQRLAAAPRTVTVPEGAGKIQVVIDDGRFMQSLALALSDNQDVLGLIPSVIASGDVTVPASHFVSEVDSREPSAADVAEWCAEDAGTLTHTQLQTQQDATPMWQSVADPAFMDVCPRFNFVRVPDVATTPTATVPVLILHGDLTPWAPRNAMSTFTAGLPHTQILSLPNHATGNLGWPVCVERIREQFVRKTDAKLHTKSCAARDTPIAFASVP